MLRRLFAPTTVALLTGGLWLAPLRAGESNKSVPAVAAKPDGMEVHTGDLHPFTHLAYLPAGADPGTIRFEKVKLVKVATRVKYAMDSNYCKQLAFRDPGGSIACPSAETEASAPAYEVTYSVTGQPLASDEHANPNFTFSVYFRPDELAADMQRTLAGGKLSRADRTAYFAVSTYREPVRRIALDETKSHFCEGNFVDGAWIHTDPGCKDNVSYTTVTAPSGYITVNVEPASRKRERAEMLSAK
jgi:hypothetical protein